MEQLGDKKIFDLKERTFLFSKQLLSALKQIPRTPLNQNQISQCIRSGTSIGANYWEADCAQSKKDFEHKIGICKKEAQETEYWLRLLIHLDSSRELVDLLDEVNQLRKIFISIVKKSRESPLPELGIKN